MCARARGRRTRNRGASLAAIRYPHQCRGQRCTAETTVSTQHRGDGAAAQRHRPRRAESSRPGPLFEGRLDPCRPCGPDVARARGSEVGAQLSAGRTMTDQTRIAWAYLSRVAEPPCPELAALVDQKGPVEAAERVKRGEVGERLLARTEARRGID